ncbi:MAG: FAD-dependent oxidoreductase [Oscillospiraceae bacterium]|nr:FAD-dependent oxidoreductase [Oscillospiraceae bacterium]
MPEYPALPGDTHTDALIVGAGIAGLLCAYFLQRKGVRDITVIDAGEVCGGVTARTTAKITSQHGLLYTKLLKGLGAERAAHYLAANEAAIRQYGEIIRHERIDCDFISCNAWVFTAHEEDLPSFEEEVRTVQKLGVQAVFSNDTELPLAVKGAIRFPDQAHFHPLKFSRRICELLTETGCGIYTHTAALGMRDGAVVTDRGTVRAKHVISCSHYPFIDKSALLFARIFQERSYVLALQNAGTIRDMYIDCRDDGFSFRPYGDMTLFGAYDHKTGHQHKTRHFEALLAEARRGYPQAETVRMWSAQDCMTHDGIPYIGQYRAAGENVYIAAGFNKWGMTSAVAAAEIISDQITKGGSEYQDAFCLERGDAGLQAGSFVKNAADVAVNLTAGLTHAVEPVCTHMGCAVKWNPDENTWDCTCHGSRFDTEGNVISGPALKPLNKAELAKH